MRRRVEDKVIVVHGVEVRINDQKHWSVLAHADFSQRNSMYDGCYRNVKCPECGRLIHTAIDVTSSCVCGYKFFVDYDGDVTEIENNVEYETAPESIKQFLTPMEIARRESRFKEDVTTICPPWDPREGVVCSCQSISSGHASIQELLTERKKRKEHEITQAKSENDGCLIILIVVFVVCLIAGLKEASILPALLPLVLLIFFARQGGKENRTIIQQWNEDDERLQPLIRDLYMNEAMRLKDNLKAEMRWKERIDEETERIKAEQALEVSRQERIRVARETEQGRVRAICRGDIGFREFLECVRDGDGHAYENQVMKFVQMCGFDCKRVANSADQGVDLIINDGVKTVAVQCKYYSSGNVGNDAVQQAFTGTHFYSCAFGVVLTNAGFTQSAVEAADRVGIKLYNHDRIVDFLVGLHAGKEKLDRLIDRDVVIPAGITEDSVEFYKKVMRAVHDA